MSYVAIWRSIPGRENSHCKCPKMGACLACWRNSKEARVDGVELMKSRVRDEAREVRERVVFRGLYRPWGRL